MALRIPVPDTSFAENTFSLGGINYRFVFRFNDRDERWRIDIYINDDPVKLGIKVMENQLFLSRYRLEDFDHGDIGCFRVLETTEPVGRNNLGIDKAYELIYLTNEEILSAI